MHHIVSTTCATNETIRESLDYGCTTLSSLQFVVFLLVAGFQNLNQQSYTLIATVRCAGKHMLDRGHNIIHEPQTQKNKQSNKQTHNKQASNKVRKSSKAIKKIPAKRFKSRNYNQMVAFTQYSLATKKKLDTNNENKVGSTW